MVLLSLVFLIFLPSSSFGSDYNFLCLFQIRVQRVVRTRVAVGIKQVVEAVPGMVNQRGCVRCWTRNSFTRCERATRRTPDPTPSWRNSSSKWQDSRPESSGSGSRTSGAKTRKKRFLWNSRCNKKRLVIIKIQKKSSWKTSGDDCG